MSNIAKKYSDLLSHYKKMLGMVDCFHFNSSITRDIYTRTINPSLSEVIPITHLGIEDHRSIKSFDSKTLRLGFIGNLSAYKGFPMLKQVLTELSKEGKTQWQLDVYGNGTGIDENCANIKYKGKFSSADMQQVYSGMDLLVVPSICLETFSLIALEAISYGVPVLVSQTVGAKDIVCLYAPDFIFRTKEELKRKLSETMDSRIQLKQYNRLIMQQNWQYSLEAHLDKIEKLYQTLLEK